MTEELTYIKSPNLFADASTIIETARNVAYRSVNVVLVRRNWLLGKRIAEEQIGEQTRDELYGKSLIQNLANDLTATYGSGFDFSSLYKVCSLLSVLPKHFGRGESKIFSPQLDALSDAPPSRR